MTGPPAYASGRAHARAAIVSIGDELTLGQKLDSNSQWISARLVDLGIRPVEHVTVEDDAEALHATLHRLAAVVDLIVCTGGLGPTADDLTRQALARVCDDPLVEDAEALREIEAWFTGRGRAMPQPNRVQALRPRSARSLSNRHGTAPGLAATLIAEGVDVYCLPGPPREMMPMFEACVKPLLRPPPDRQIRTRVLHTFGLGESAVGSLLDDLMARGRNPVVGTTASGGVVSCRLRLEGAVASGAALDALEVEVRRRLGAVVFGSGDDTPASVVLGLLAARGERIVVVESCTGGLLGKMLTDVPGASTSVEGGWLTYSNSFKQRMVGVAQATLERKGAVSRQTAEAMATGGRERGGVDHCLAITGVAGPDGGTAEKPVGTVWIAHAGPGGVDARCFRFGGDRHSVRHWSAVSALGLLRLKLLGLEMTLLNQVE
ncbi:MAG: competence/damage-inducible protein A [Phycisphaeraceae bacterium]|nr:competence/damage-inducible protein A [Phycisphaeraceae bacterium]